MENTKSVFVSVLGWITVIVSGLGVFVSILQNIMVQTMFPAYEMHEALAQDATFEEFPIFLFSNIRLLVALVGVVIFAIFIVSVAFLKRKNWARVGMTVIFALGILYNLSSLLLQWLFMGFMDTDLPQAPEGFNEMMQIMKIFMVVFALGISGLFTWIIIKLNSESIKREFGAALHNNDETPLQQL
jgi:heme/copper-type cytochrome/quinol oxidase subunit 2